MKQMMICGVDEAGRGPVLGPMVVAAVMVDDDSELRMMNVRDSKKLTPSSRERLAVKIREIASIEIAVIPAEEID
ncbi:MAG: ribonuclease HII, partial [Methanomassiliicoccales archaeon]|nr:ribonuclease HII [Methanomassiliicoccales archaeon]